MPPCSGSNPYLLSGSLSVQSLGLQRAERVGIWWPLPTDGPSTAGPAQYSIVGPVSAPSARAQAQVGLSGLSSGARPTLAPVTRGAG